MREFSESVELKDNSILKIKPELFQEWDFSENEKIGLDIYKISFGSNKKAHWICRKCKGKFSAIVNNRTKGTKCPFCTNKKVNGTNSLASKNSSLALEWHPSKNMPSTPNKIVATSNKKVWWMCLKCCHEWEAKVVDRGNRLGCPMCAGFIVNEFNNITSVQPELLEIWDYSKNKDSPSEYIRTSNKEVWWKCKNHEHSFKRSVANQKNSNNCPYCMNREVLVGFNDMWTTNEELASNLLYPKDGYKYTSGSGVKLSWRCPTCRKECKKETPCRIAERGIKCSRCSKTISKGERLVHNLLEFYKIEFRHETSLSWSAGKRYDFVVEQNGRLSIIEVHGQQHYSEKGFSMAGGRTAKEEQENDKFKENMAKENGIDSYTIINSKVSDYDYIVSSIMNSSLFANLGISKEDICWDKILPNDYYTKKTK